MGGHEVAACIFHVDKPVADARRRDVVTAPVPESYLRDAADRDRTASSSTQIWKGKRDGQRSADFSGVSRRYGRVRKCPFVVAPTRLIELWRCLD